MPLAICCAKRRLRIGAKKAIIPEFESEIQGIDNFECPDLVEPYSAPGTPLDTPASGVSEEETGGTGESGQNQVELTTSLQRELERVEQEERSDDETDNSGDSGYERIEAPTSVEIHFRWVKFAIWLRAVSKWKKLYLKKLRLRFKRRQWAYLGHLLKHIKQRGMEE